MHIESFLVKNLKYKHNFQFAKKNALVIQLKNALQSSVVLMRCSRSTCALCAQFMALADDASLLCLPCLILIHWLPQRTPLSASWQQQQQQSKLLLQLLQPVGQLTVPLFWPDCGSGWCSGCGCGSGLWPVRISLQKLPSAAAGVGREAARPLLVVLPLTLTLWHNLADGSQFCRGTIAKRTKMKTTTKTMLHYCQGRQVAKEHPSPPPPHSFTKPLEKR